MLVGFHTPCHIFVLRCSSYGSLTELRRFPVTLDLSATLKTEDKQLRCLKRQYVLSLRRFASAQNSS